MPHVPEFAIAFNVPTLDAALALDARLGEGPEYAKLGLELFVSSGPEAMKALKSRGRRVFLDLKLHDIPNTVKGAAASAARIGADLLTVHATGGPAMVAAAVEGIREAGGTTQVVAVTLLTSLDPADMPPGFQQPFDLHYRLVASPIDIADTLRDHLFGRLDTAVLTSATLSAAGSFSYIEGRIGLDAPAELLLDSPFDFQNQAMLYIPPGLDDQQAAGYQERFDRELTAILGITRGRTLVLFTSYGQLRKTRDALRCALPDLGILCQGEMPAYRLVEQFKERPDAVLLGTASFWQGIDIPGDALQCVVIAKLPFAVPDEPLIEARMERLKNPFYEYQVPQATLLFRQGFGRLIRTKTDRGAVAVLDSRIVTKNYGRTFLRSIP